MSNQRTPIEAVVTDPRTSEEIELDNQVNAVKVSKEGLRAQLYERTAANSALNVKLPPHLHGEWVRNEPLRIRDKQDLGFVIDKVYAPKQSLHNANSDGSATVGDLIFMVCHKDTKKHIDELQREEYERRHGKPGQKNVKQAEERGFAAQQGTLTGSHIGTVTESAAIPVALDTSKQV